MKRAWLYKGKDAKIFNDDEINKAQAEGWVDTPAEAEKINPSSKKPAAPKASASGATTFQGKE